MKTKIHATDCRALQAVWLLVMALLFLGVGEVYAKPAHVTPKAQGQVVKSKALPKTKRAKSKLAEPQFSPNPPNKKVRLNQAAAIAPRESLSIRKTVVHTHKSRLKHPAEENLTLPSHGDSRKLRRDHKKPYCYPYVSPAIPVRAALLYNMNTGQILYQHNANVPIPPASLTKVMTLFLAFDAVKQGRLSLKKRIKVSRHAACTGGSSMHLRFGERLPLANLIIGTAVASGNDAATAVAETVNANLPKFVQLMNAKAASLGMRQTRFCNPTGLPAGGQISTAADMLKLALAYLRNHPQALNYHNIATFYHGGRLLSTTNPLLGGVCGVNGLKTGWTTASGYNIIVTAQRGATRLLVVVMGGRSRVSRDYTARKLLEAGFRNATSPKEVRTAFFSHKPRHRAHKKSNPKS